MIYIAKLAVLCTISETPNRPEDEKWIVFPRNVRQATWIVRQGYMSLASWMESSLKVKAKPITDLNLLPDYIESWNVCKNNEGWAYKADMREYAMKQLKYKNNAFYNGFKKVQTKFETKKDGKKVYLRLIKEEEENESNL